MRYIPKKIHLIWVGRNPYSEIVKKCIASWEKYCPDYEIKIWNEDNFDINSNLFVKEAYDNKKWAFVSDYIRLYALYNEGGVYIDSDCELFRNIDDILENEHVVTGYSSSNWIPSGFMASEKKNKWIKLLMDYYEDRHFVLENGDFDMKVNNVIITELSSKYCDFKAGDLWINYGSVRLYPRVYFHPFPKKVVDWKKVNLNKVKNYYKYDSKKTYCIHYGTATWVDNRNTFYYRIKHLIRLITPQILMEPLERIYYKYHRWNQVK
ncbi:MAG: hypothetical protein KHZ15_03540 [Coprobacillus cateniformis]|nr:hypothetical protein [Coprobacillus cateniformis]